jgi:hypothetical protein
MAIALDQKRGISHDGSSKIEFPVVEIASLIGWDNGTVKRHLKNLEWTKGKTIITFLFVGILKDIHISLGLVKVPGWR